MQIIKQSTARTLLVGPFLDDTDGKTAETGLTVTQADVRLSKNGGNMAQKNEATSCTHDELGYYTCPVDVTDTATLGILKLMISESGSLPVWQEFLVVTANVWDTLCSTDTFQADLTQIAGVVQSATDLQDFADSGYDPATNKVQGVVLVDSNTDMRGTDSAATEAKQDIIDTNVDAILVDTGTTLDALIKDVPTVAEFDARSLPSADYVITTDTIAGVTLCTTCTTNTDMRGTDGANTAVPDVAGTAATPAEVATALTDIHLDHLLAVDYDPASKPGVATALLNELIESDGGVSRYTANALEQAPSAGTNPNVLVDTTIAVVTDQTHFTLTAGSDIDDSYLDQAIVIYDASNNDFPSVRKVSDYIGATKTITLDSAPDFTILAGDGARTFVTAPGTVAPTASQNADAVWDEVLSGGAHNVGDSAGKRLREMFDAGLYEEETAQGGTLTTITLAATASALDDYYNAMSLTIIEGTGAGQVRTFEDYDGATRVATACRDWSVTPDATSKYVISGDSCVKVFGFQQRVLDDINAECDTALTDYDPPTNTEMVAAFTEIKGTTWTSGTDTLEHLRNKQTDIETDTSEIGAAGAGLTALGDARIANLDATVSSRLAPAGTLATVTNLTNAPTAGDLTATMKTSINTEADTALSDIHLDHLLATDYDPASKPGTATALLNELIEDDAGVSRYTANALEQAPSGATNPNVLIDTTIAVVTDQTHFTLTAGSDIDDAYKDQAIVLYDASNSDFPSIRKVSSYTGATKTITLDSASDFTILAGDGVKVFVTAPGTVAPTVGDIRTEMEGAGTKLTLVKDKTDNLPASPSPANEYDIPMGYIPSDLADVPTTSEGAKLSPQGKLDVNYECDTALSDYDPPTRTETTADKDEIVGDIAALNNISVADIIAGVADGSYDLQEMLRIIFSACAGKSSGGNTGFPKFRDIADSKYRIEATVDSSGNRTAITLDGA